jgi:hypothetical protein
VHEALEIGGRIAAALEKLTSSYTAAHEEEEY